MSRRRPRRPSSSARRWKCRRPRSSIDIPVDTAQSTAITDVTDRPVPMAPPPPPPPKNVVHAKMGKNFPNSEDYYPAASKRLGEEGAITVKVCVGPNGKLAEEPTVTQSSGSARLDDGALKLAKAGRYVAGSIDGAADHRLLPLQDQVRTQELMNQCRACKARPFFDRGIYGKPHPTASSRQSIWSGSPLGAGRFRRQGHAYHSRADVPVLLVHHPHEDLGSAEAEELGQGGREELLERPQHQGRRRAHARRATTSATSPKTACAQPPTTTVASRTASTCTSGSPCPCSVRWMS